MSGPNCLSRDAAKASPITAITANAWSANKTNFSFSPNAVIPTAPAIIANKGRQHGAAKAITRAPTVPRPSNKATVRVRRLMLISAKVSQSRQSRPRSEECQHWSTPTLDNPSDNSSLLFLFACSQDCDKDAGEFYFHWFSFFVLFLRFFIEPHFGFGIHCSTSSFCRYREALLAFAAWTVVGNSPVPIAGHIGFDFGAVLAGCTGFFRRAATMHCHAGHVHVDRKINIANIDKLPVGVAKLDQDIVVAFLKLTCWSHQFYLEIVHGLGGKRRASNFSRRGFVPNETRAVNQPNRDEGGSDDSWQLMPDAVRWYQHRRHNWPRLFFSPIWQFAFSPDNVNHRIDQQLEQSRSNDSADHRRGDAFHDIRAGLQGGGPHDRQESE